MKKLLVFLGVVLSTIGSAVRAQEVDNIPDISLDMRGGYAQDFSEGAGRFFGDGLYLNMDGTIGSGFSYSVNQRLASSYYEDNSGFNGTNWLTLTYETGNFAFTAGKDAIFVGSFEYDAYDLDTYYEMNSAFYNDFDCWQWGVSAAWYPAEEHEVLFQIANSPIAPGQLAIAAGWRGSMDWYESYWTVNLWEHDLGITPAVALGNRFNFGLLTVDFDLMARFGETDLNSYTATLAPSFQFSDWGRLFTKVGMEEENAFFGCGLEYFPLRENKDVRLHATYTYNDYTVGHLINLGLTWKMNVTQTIKNIFTRLNR